MIVSLLVFFFLLFGVLERLLETFLLHAEKEALGEGHDEEGYPENDDLSDQHVSAELLLFVADLAIA